MATSYVEQAQRNWERRAQIFSGQGIQFGTYQQLYNRDMAGVFNGGQPMTDAEVYSGVESAVKGPQIQDPQAQHGGHGLFSGILDTLGNIPRDIGGIITGFPAGVVHTIAHLPSEVTNSGELLWHLAEGDNTWLLKKGYLTKGDTLHESWSDFGTILRAMDRNGSKQLLPYLPFISDLANMTSGQGRKALMQHPVGAFLDVLPGIARGGRFVTKAADLGGQQMARIEALKNSGNLSPFEYRQALDSWNKNYGQPKFYAAGRALQAGNPVKALVSAAGDLIPAGTDDFLGKMTLRQRTLVAANTMGIDRISRQINRGFAEASDKLEYQVNAWMRDSFGSDFWRTMTPDRAHYLYLGTHAINPDSGEVFRTVEEYNTWRKTKLSPEENAGIDVATAIAEAQRQGAIQKGAMAEVPFAHGLETVSTKSVAYRSWRASQYYEELMQSALDRIDQAVTPAAQEKARRQLSEATAKYKGAMDRFAKAQVSEFPEQWNDAMAQKVRQGAEGKAGEIFAGKQLEDALKTIKDSVWSNDYVRLFGEKQYNALVGDAIRWWHDASKNGLQPIWTHRTDPVASEHILEPTLGTIDKIKAPSAYSARELGLYFGDTVFALDVSITAHQVEIMRQEIGAQFINDYVLPRAYDKRSKWMEYNKAADLARALHPGTILPSPSTILKQNFEDFNPDDFGLRRTAFKHTLGKEMILDKDTAINLRRLMSPRDWNRMGGKWIMRGTSLYKFSVLTGPRHLAHVTFGGLMFMMLREPLAPIQFLRAIKIMNGSAKPEDHGLAHGMLSGLKQKVYQIGPHHTWQEHGIGPYHAWNHAAGGVIGDGVTADWVHQAKQAGTKVAEFIPNKLARLEENVISMYKVATYLSAKSRGLDRQAALETAQKVFVDVNGMSVMERTMVKTIFPFYAFTRHLFRYLATYPVDYPLRAAMLSQFAEGEQADWKNGLPRSYMSLLWLGQPDKSGNVAAIDLKNANPFRSFANDFSFAGFFSSLSPFLTGPLAAIGVDTLSGTTQLYPGLSYNPQTGSLQASPPPGGIISLAESFVPQVGLLDHFFQLTNSTRLMSQYSPLAYRKQIYNMLNVPFVPEVINVPYEQEITEIRRFRAAQAAVTLVDKNPSTQNVSKLLEWNTVPFNNELIPPSILAAYFARVKAALAKAGHGNISPKAIIPPPPRRTAVIQNF